MMAQALRGRQAGGSLSGPGPTVTVWSDAVYPTNYYRCMLPLRTLQRAGLIAEHSITRGPTREDQPKGDLLVAVHMTTQWQAEALGRFQDGGGVLIMDDDHDLDEIAFEDVELAGEDAQWAGTLHHHLPMRPGEGMRTYLARLLVWYVEHSWPIRDQAGQRALDHLATAAAAQLGVSHGDARAWVGQRLQDASTRYEALNLALWLSPLAGFCRIVHRADLLTVSTPYLAQTLYQQYGTRAMVLPNCIDLDLPCYQPDSRQRSHEGVVIGWTGGPSHAPDMAAILPALRQVLQEYDGTGGKPLVRVMLGGDGWLCRAMFRELPGGQSFAERVPATSVHETTMTQEGVECIDSACGRFRYCFWTQDIDQAPRMYDDVDIGIVPNRPHARANLARSDVKGLEMAGMGVSCVASPTPAYRAWRREGTGCIVLGKHEPESWLTALRRLIEDEALRQRMAEEALAFAQTRSIDVWAPKWMEAYEEATRRAGKTWVPGDHR